MTKLSAKTFWIALGLIVLSGTLYLGTAGSSALVDDDVDAAHALVAREMLQRHNFVVPYMDGIRYLIRPPMHFWLVAASYALFGETEFATRLPLALAMMGLVLLTFAFGRRFFGERAGLYAALIAATSAGMYIFTRIMIPEALYALEFTAIFYLFLRSWTGSLDPRIGYWGASAVCGLAVLTRGPIALFLPGGAVVAFLTLTRSWGRWRELRLFSSIAVFLAVAAPWHILVGLRAPGFYWEYFVNENINRAMGTRIPHDYSAVPLWLWWIELLAWLFPWSFFAPLAIRELPPLRTWRRGLDSNRQARLLLFCWAGIILLFFSVESGSRMEYYSFGAWPALALLLGLGIAHAEQTNERWHRLIGSALAVLGVAMAAAAGAFLWSTSRVTASGNFVSDLQTHGSNFYHSSMAHVLDLTPGALVDLRGPILTVAGSLCAAFILAWLLRKRGFQVLPVLALALGMVGFFFAANSAIQTFASSLSSRSLALKINKILRPADQIALYGDIRVAPTIAFYCNRRVLLLDATGSNLRFGSRYPDAPKTFYTSRDFDSLWEGKRRVLLVVPDHEKRSALAQLPKDSAWVLAMGSDKIVYVNRQPAAFATHAPESGPAPEIKSAHFPEPAR